MASVLMPAATHHFSGTGSASSSTLKNATSTTFSPSTGVATDTSPLCNALNVKICPKKNSVPARTGCHPSATGRPAPPSSQNGAKKSPIATFDTNAVRHTPTP